jgi:hypothetical protein
MKLIAEKLRSEGTEFASVFITFTATLARIEPWFEEALPRHCWLEAIIVYSAVLNKQAVWAACTHSEVCEFGKGTVIFVVVFQLFLQILLYARKDARRQFRIWTCSIRQESIGHPMYIIRLLIEPALNIASISSHGISGN